MEKKFTTQKTVNRSKCSFRILSECFSININHFHIQQFICSINVEVVSDWNLRSRLVVRAKKSHRVNDEQIELGERQLREIVYLFHISGGVCRRGDGQQKCQTQI